MNPATQMSRGAKITIGVLAVALVASIAFNLTQANQVKTLKDPNGAAQNQIRKVVADVGKLIVLPANETPTIATVSDLTPLKSQPFFANAAVGDQVLIYTTARKVILWRPAENKIIEVAPLTVNTVPTPSSALPTVSPTSTVPKK
jgi:hypothetical protein